MEDQRSWDGHNDIEGNHQQFADETDQPVAGLLTDLAQRGLLSETLVIWSGEFGRLPIAQTGAKPERETIIHIVFRHGWQRAEPLPHKVSGENTIVLFAIGR